MKAENCVISNVSSKIIPYKNNNKCEHSKFIQTNNPIEVSSKSLNDIFEDEKIEKYYLLKLDCENLKHEIIKNLKQKYFEKMVIEYHVVDSNPELLENLKSKLIKKSYKMEIEP